MTNPFYEPVANAMQEMPFNHFDTSFGRNMRDAMVDSLREAAEEEDDPAKALVDFADLCGFLTIGLVMAAHRGMLCSACIGNSVMNITEAIIDQKQAQEEVSGTHEEKH